MSNIQYKDSFVDLRGLKSLRSYVVLTSSEVNTSFTFLLIKPGNLILIYFIIPKIVKLIMLITIKIFSLKMGFYLTNNE